MPETAGRHLALIVTTSLSVFFFRRQVARLKTAGFRVTLICAPGPQTAPLITEGAEFVSLPMEREVAPFKDLRSMWLLWRLLRRLRPDITNVGTPKAGLLGGIAARLAGVPHRVYTLHGLKMETATGWKRRVLTWAERVACWNAHYVRCVGPSLRKRAIELGLVPAEKAYVIVQGSSNGVDVDHYRRTPQRMAQAKELRRNLGIPDSASIIGFVGRLTRDKGINELYRAFMRLKKDFPDAWLLLLGDFEDGDPVNAEVRQGLENDAQVALPGSVADMAPYYAVMDVMTLPSYREGLPTVCLEAQAAGVPVVTTMVTGAVDSIVDGVTGKLVRPGNEEAMAEALRELLNHPENRRRMGEAGAAWVGAQFRQEVVWRALIEDYERICRSGDRVIG